MKYTLNVTKESIDEYCRIYFSTYSYVGYLLAKENYLQKLFIRVPIDDMDSQAVIAEELERVTKAKLLVSEEAKKNCHVQKKSLRYGRHFS